MIIFTDEELRHIALKNINDLKINNIPGQIALEIARNRSYMKSLRYKIEKLEKNYPNMKTEKAQNPDIFYYGKCEAYREIINSFKATEENTLLESLENAIEKETKQN